MTVADFAFLPSVSKLHLGTRLLRQLLCQSEAWLSNGIARTMLFLNGVWERGMQGISMYPIIKTRPLTDFEKSGFYGKPSVSSGCVGWGGLAIAGWLLSTLIFTGVCVQSNHLELLDPPWFFLLSLPCWIILCVGVSKWQRGRALKTIDRKQKAIVLELAEVLTFSASDAIQVEEVEDEGSSYFLRLTDGQVVFLSGQYLYNYEEEKRFPCTEFDVVRTSNSKIVLGLDCRGPYFPASKQLPPFRPNDFENAIVPEDLEMISVPWNQVEARYWARR